MDVRVPAGEGKLLVKWVWVQRLGGGQRGAHSWNWQGNPNRESVKAEGQGAEMGREIHPVSPALGK